MADETYDVFMTVETVLAVIGLALGFASLVPAFTTKDPKKKIILVFVGVAFVGIFALQLWIACTHARAIERLKEEITNQIIGSRAVTLEELHKNLYYRDFSDVQVAIDELMKEERLHHEVIEVKSARGAQYTIRIYYFNAYEIR